MLEIQRLYSPMLQVAYAWATSLNEDEAAALLRRLNMGEGVVEYAMEIGAFNHAFQIAQLAAKHKLADVHLKYAMFLEDSGRFVEAEGEFVAAGGLCLCKPITVYESFDSVRVELAHFLLLVVQPPCACSLSSCAAAGWHDTMVSTHALCPASQRVCRQAA